VPTSGDLWNQPVLVGAGAQTKKALSLVNAVSQGYLHTATIDLVGGRDFGPEDTLHSPKVAIVSQAFQRTLFKDVDPLGQTFRFQVGPGETETTYHVIGIMRDTKYTDLREDFQPLVFLALPQRDEQDSTMTVFTQSPLDERSLKAAIVQSAAVVSPTVTMGFASWQSQVRDSLVLERLMATLSGFLGALAGLLAVVGLYGVISYSVERRQHEMGIRAALGADKRRVIAMIVREALRPLIVGLVLGVGAAMAASRAVAALLFGLTPTDVPTLLGASMGLALVALAATALPARRAAGFDPMRALRED
jgi:putative ABC transport system permease protein